MAINKSAKQQQSDEVVKTLLTATPKHKMKRLKKLKNLRIDEQLADDFDVLCKIKKTTFTDMIVLYMQDEVDANIECINKLKNALS